MGGNSEEGLHYRTIVQELPEPARASTCDPSMFVRLLDGAGRQTPAGAVFGTRFPLSTEWITAPTAAQHMSDPGPGDSVRSAGWSDW